jgi:hypothetical protein
VKVDALQLRHAEIMKITTGEAEEETTDNDRNARIPIKTIEKTLTRAFFQWKNPLFSMFLRKTYPLAVQPRVATL